MKMREALYKLYNGKKAFSRQLTLFSICGIVGVLDAYAIMNGLDSLLLWEKLAYVILWMLFAFFFIGYETKFMHDRELPDADGEAFRLTCCKYLFFIFLAGCPLITAKFFPKYIAYTMLVELLLAVPFTIIQAGFSYNYNSDEVFDLFPKLNMSNYIALLIKRIWIILVAYALVLVLVFMIFFFAGIIVALIYSGDVSEILFAISSNQTVLGKLSSFISEIFLVYLLSVGTLVWDYELIKTYEREEE